MNDRTQSAQIAKSSDKAPIPANIVSRVGVLLINLGTPDAPDRASVRRYLREFLSDRRVIEAPRWFWLPLLNLVILPFRSPRSAKAYAGIWNLEQNESPLKTFTRRQAEKLAHALARETRITVDWAMRYANPSIASRLDALIEAGCERILIVPLYPQYSASTTATVQDAVFAALESMRFQPSLRMAPPYYRDPLYIDALAISIQSSLAKLDFQPDMVLASFHGLPQSYVAKGDPYLDHCQETTNLLRERLGWTESFFRLTFQSRFGREKWLGPYTIETVAEVAKAGVRKLAVVMPGFAADCLETLSEIAIENGEVFHENGGERFAALPCLNDSPESIALLESLVRRELQGWIASPASLPPGPALR